MYDWYMEGIAQIKALKDGLEVIQEKKEIVKESEYSKKVREVVRRKILEKIEQKKIANRATMNETFKKLREQGHELEPVVSWVSLNPEDLLEQNTTSGSNTKQTKKSIARRKTKDEELKDYFGDYSNTATH